MRGVWIYSWTIQHSVTKIKNFSGRFCNYDLKGYIFVYISTPTLNKFNTKYLVSSDSVLLNYSFTFQALYIIRYHSFFPWHCSGDYNYLCDDKDMKMLEWVKEFNKFDLYSKSDSVPDVEAVSPYYEELIAKYCPGELSW